MMISLKAQIAKPEQKKLMAKQFNYRNCSPSNALQQIGQENASIRKMAYQNLQLAGTQEKFFSRSPSRYEQSPERAPINKPYATQLFGKKSTNQQSSPLKDLSTPKVATNRGLQSNIFPACPQENQQQVNYFSQGKVVKPLGFSGQNDQKRIKVYQQLKKQINQSYQQHCNQVYQKNDSKINITAFFRQNLKQKHSEQSLIKNRHTRSSIQCIPGEQHYKHNENEDSRSASREKMFIKRNRSAVFDKEETNNHDRSFEQRIQHYAQKFQLTSMQMQQMYNKTQGPQISPPDEIPVKRLNSGYKNHSREVQTLIMHGDMRQSSRGQQVRSPLRRIPEGVIDQNRSNFVIS